MIWKSCKRQSLTFQNLFEMKGFLLNWIFRCISTLSNKELTIKIFYPLHTQTADAAQTNVSYSIHPQLSSTDRFVSGLLRYSTNSVASWPVCTFTKTTLTGLLWIVSFHQEVCVILWGFKQIRAQFHEVRFHALTMHKLRMLFLAPNYLTKKRWNHLYF